MNQFFRTFLLFLVLWIGLSLLLPKPQPQVAKSDVSVVLAKSEISQGGAVALRVRNNLESPLVVGEKCPEQAKIEVLRHENGLWKTVSAASVLPCKVQTLTPHEWITIDFVGVSHAIFGEAGKYQIAVPVVVHGVEKRFSADLVVNAPGFFRSAWNLFLYRPIYNALMYLSSVSAMHLGFGIVLLTIIIRLLLLGPSITAMKSQRLMQKVQPEMSALREKWKHDQMRLATETTALWKKHGIKPMSAIVPLLWQIPILIALFFVIQEGVTPDNIWLLYAPLSTINIAAISPHFLWLDLTKIDIIVLPLVVGLAQFVQMKLAMAKVPAPSTGEGFAASMAQASKMMVYVMPVMVALFSATLPSGVGLYWFVSALFSIAQQVWINRFV